MLELYVFDLIHGRFFFLTGRVTEFRKICEDSVNVVIMFLFNFSERCAFNLLQRYLLTDQMCGILLCIVS